jgi:hypothetical protein
VARAQGEDGGSNEKVEWQVGQRDAREARENVGYQLYSAVVDGDRTGSIEMVRKRAGELRDAEAGDDPMLRRAAAWELALAAAAYAVALDLGHGRSGRARVAA